MKRSAIKAMKAKQKFVPTPSHLIRHGIKEPEISNYYKLNGDKVNCRMCNHEVDLNKGFGALEPHMIQKHSDLKWKKERFIKGNNK